MARWQNFSVWRGRLPHWRADDVCYYVTFRHRRDLSEDERADLFSALLKPDGRQWRLDLLLVLPSETRLLAIVETGPGGRPYELSDIVEKAKRRAGKVIVKRSGERFPPFYSESFDRIVRDEGELESLWDGIQAAPADGGLAGQDGDYRFLWLGAGA